MTNNLDDRLRTTLDEQRRLEQSRLETGRIANRTHAPTDIGTGSAWRRFAPGLVAAVFVLAAVPLGIVLLADSGSNDPVTIEASESESSVSSTSEPSSEPTSDTTTETGNRPAATDDSEFSAPATAIGITEGDNGRDTLVRFDPVSGEVVEQIMPFDAEASWISRIQSHPDLNTLYFARQYEDYWYTCPTAPMISELDLATGQERELANGFQPRLSPDGTRLLYLQAAVCHPDPSQEGTFRSMADTVVVRDLASGAETSWVDASLADLGPADDDVRLRELINPVWVDDDQVAVGGNLLDVETLVVVGEVADLRLGALESAVPADSFLDSVGVDRTTGEALIEVFSFGTERNSTVLLAVDLQSGETVERARIESEFSASSGWFALDSSQTHLLSSDTTVSNVSW